VIFDQSTAPVAILGAAAGMAGSARAQLNLRASCVFLDMHPLNKPEVLIFQAQNKVDAGGKLTDETARGLLRELMRRLRRLVSFVPLRGWHRGQPPPAIRFLTEQRQRVAAAPHRFARGRGDRQVDAVASEGPIAEHLNLHDLVGSVDLRRVLGLGCRLERLAAERLPAGDHETTSLVISESTVAESPLRLARIQVSTASRIACSSSVTFVLPLND
jgi:hypothetical protein